MFIRLNSPFRFVLRKSADDGSDLAGDDTSADYGDDFVATDDDESDGGAGRDDARAAADDEGADDAGAGDDLRAAGDVDETGDEQAKSTSTPKTGKGKFIPLDRHEKLLKKEREKREALESQLQQSRSGQEVAQVNEQLEAIENTLVTMEKKYNDLLAEGDTEGAAQMMTAIRRKNAELNQVSAQQRDAVVMARAVEKVRYDEALERIEEQYPEINPDSDEFDEAVYEDVLDLMRAAQARGMSATKALQRAVSRTLGAETAAQKRATSVQPRVNEDDVAGARRKDAVRRNIDASNRQPPATHRAGAGNNASGGALTAKAIMEMSEAEFEKLSEKDLSKLRGDTF